MIRPTTRADQPTLVAMAQGTGVFKPMEIESLDGVFDEYFEAYQAEGHQAITYEDGGHLLGFAYYAPTWMTDRTWHLWWIVVKKDVHARGIGSTLLRHLEAEIRGQRGRLLLIETSSLPSYEPTRRFYLKHQYEQNAVVRGYYADGDDMVVFSKRMSEPEA
jgi:ribosomal protein S18 acetylase RimI-like enzyme